MCFASAPKKVTPSEPKPVPAPPPPPEEPPKPAAYNDATTMASNDDAAGSARRLGTRGLRIDLNLAGAPSRGLNIPQ